VLVNFNETRIFLTYTKFLLTELQDLGHAARTDVGLKYQN